MNANTPVTVGSLWFTYIKSTRGHWLTTLGEKILVDGQGILHDRRWVVVDKNSNFVAQRQGSASIPLVGQVNIPSRFGGGVAIRTMCQVASHIAGDMLVIAAPNMHELRVPVNGISGAEEEVAVWRNPPARAVDQGKEASDWFSEFLSREETGTYRLMRMSDTSFRPSKVGGARMGFQDSFPFMMISDASLGALNGKLLGHNQLVVTADRFRPNVWLSGCLAHAEDHFRQLRIGNILFEGATLCDRCAVICTEQQTGKVGPEPSATLAAYRKGETLLTDPAYHSPRLGLRGKEKSIFFGANFSHSFVGPGPQYLTVGDKVEVLATD